MLEEARAIYKSAMGKTNGVTESFVTDGKVVTAVLAAEQVGAAGEAAVAEAKTAAEATAASEAEAKAAFEAAAAAKAAEAAAEAPPRDGDGEAASAVATS